MTNTIQEQLALFHNKVKKITEHNLINPLSYKGISGFHKYWGKKPSETLGYLIENLSDEKEVVCDPFLGSGLIVLEATARNRKFVGIDLNPISIKFAELYLDFPSKKELINALDSIRESVLSQIHQSYKMKDADIASHYLWQDSEMLEVWSKQERGKKMIKKQAEKVDLKLYNEYKNYNCKFLRKAKFFNNSRINSNSNISINDLFTGRALRNIEILLEKINIFEPKLQRALKLCLTSGSGQMSKMVFAIKNRGKMNGRANGDGERIEVGSWAIGFWRPKLHFEINVWDCFERRVKKLAKAVENLANDIVISSTSKVDIFLKSEKGVCLINGHASDVLGSMPKSSISVIITDPPHSDRIPYLELSEMWNVLLNENSDFDKEIVVSNARDRSKDLSEYTNKMIQFINESKRVLVDNGVLALMFSAKDKESWAFIEKIIQRSKNSILKYKGFISVNYSVNSLVQDNRKGSIDDYILFFDKGKVKNSRLEKIKKLAHWKEGLPNK